MQAYCVRCKVTREMNDEHVGKTKRGVKLTRGKCPVCGTTMSRIG